MEIFLDIETVRDPDFESNFESRLGKSDLLRIEELPEEEREAARNLIIDKAGLNPGTGKICCIGMVLRSDIDDTASPVELSSCSDNEKEILEYFWGCMKQLKNDYIRIVTFNGKDFDVPYILIRSAINGIIPTRVLPSNKWNDSYRVYRGEFHFDLWEFLRGFYNKGKFGASMDFWLKSFGLSEKTEQGSAVGEMFENKEYDRIAAYCLNDCKVTMELYDKIFPILKEGFAGTQ